MRTFSSSERKIKLTTKPGKDFLPELFRVLKEEARQHKPDCRNPGILPAYDIRMVRIMPSGQEDSVFYYPNHTNIDDIYNARLEIVAGTIELDSATGLRNALLATVEQNCTGLVLNVRSVKNLAVDPEVLYNFFGRYSSN
jgi:hypothetical protein